MGVCLASNGINPVTGVRTLEERYVSKVLAVMSSCGMYDYSGNWLYNVGMPAKSGVGGGLLAVLPGQFGLAVYSPRLDSKGNSVRGIKVCEHLSSEFGLHMLHTSRVMSSTVIRAVYTGANIRSKQEYHPRVSNWLDKEGHQILVFEVMGELTFVSAELILREVGSKLDSCKYLIIDFARVTSIDESASRFLADMASSYQSENIKVLYVGLSDKYQFVRYIKRFTNGSKNTPTLTIKDLDHALEWCENDLLTQGDFPYDSITSTPFHEQPLCDSLNKEEIAFLESLTVPMTYPKGDIICKEGTPADQVYFLESGKVSVWVTIEGKRKLRVGGSSSGWAFGEAAILGSKRRSADVIADTAVALRELQAKDLLDSTHPLAMIVLSKVFRNISTLYDKKLRRANFQIRTLGR